MPRRTASDNLKGSSWARTSVYQRTNVRNTPTAHRAIARKRGPKLMGFCTASDRPSQLAHTTQARMPRPRPYFARVMKCLFTANPGVKKRPEKTDHSEVPL